MFHCIVFIFLGNQGLSGRPGDDGRTVTGVPGLKGDAGLPGLNGNDGAKGTVGKWMDTKQ